MFPTFRTFSFDKILFLNEIRFVRVISFPPHEISLVLFGFTLMLRITIFFDTLRRLYSIKCIPIITS